MGGVSISRLIDKISNNKKVTLLMFGLDSAGKTTILHKLNLDKVLTTTPSCDFDVESVKYKNVTFLSWDVGRTDKIRPMWRHYYEDIDGLIYVIDSNDHERVNESSKELQSLLVEVELTKASLLVFANKQDLPNALSASLMASKLELNTIRNHSWHIVPTCAFSGDGLYEGLDWLLDEINKKLK